MNPRGQNFLETSLVEASIRNITDEQFRERRELERFVTREREIERDQNRLIALIEGKSRELRELDRELDSRRSSQASVNRELQEAKREYRAFSTRVQQQSAKVGH